MSATRLPWRSDPGSGARQRASWVAWAACAFVIRLVYVVATRAWAQGPYWDFAAIAESLLDGHGYAAPPGYYWFTAYSPTAMQAPLYTFFTAAAYALFGFCSPTAHLAMQLVQCAASALCLVPLRSIARRFERPGLEFATSLGFTLLPSSIFLTAKLCATTFATLTLLTLAASVLRISDDGRSRWSVRLGLLWAVALLLYPTLGAFVAGSALWLAVRVPATRRLALWRGLFRALLVAVLVSSPWLARNWIVFHRWIPGVSTFPGVFFAGNNRFATGSQQGLDYRSLLDRKEVTAEYPFLKSLHLLGNEVAVMDRYGEAAWDFVRRQPEHAWVLFLRKLWMFWWRNPDHPAHGTPAESFYIASYLLAAGLALVGAVRELRRPCGRAVLEVIAIALLSVSLVYAVASVGMVRYRMLLEPLLVPPAAAALVWARPSRGTPPEP
jgi:4-amino-4-deoxy-L-arabinose transferase-like glycosyltransferase